MKQRIVQIVVVVGLVALAFTFRRREELPKTPEDSVSAFFDAAGNGNDEAYLQLVSGELRDSLQSAREQLGVDAFRRNLRRSAAGIKGLAVTRRNDAPPGFAALDVDIVFTDRNERQQMLLAENGNGWTIASITTSLTTQPAVAYGTPVYEE